MVTGRADSAAERCRHRRSTCRSKVRNYRPRCSPAVALGVQGVFEHVEGRHPGGLRLHRRPRRQSRLRARQFRRDRPCQVGPCHLRSCPRQLRQAAAGVFSVALDPTRWTRRDRTGARSIVESCSSRRRSRSRWRAPIWRSFRRRMYSAGRSPHASTPRARSIRLRPTIRIISCGILMRPTSPCPDIPKVHNLQTMLRQNWQEYAGYGYQTCRREADLAPFAPPSE